MKSVDAGQVRRLAESFGTPCYVYTAEVIRDRIRSLAAFDVVRFAQKACSNLHILRLVREQGALVDAVSLGEIERALRAGFRPGGEPAELIYTSDVIDEATLDRVISLGIPVNAGSEDMLDQLGRRRRGHPVWLRVNPGFGHGHSRKTNTGGESSKHGIWHENLDGALKRLDEHGLDLIGLHMHIGSGTDFEHLQKLATAMASQLRSLGRDLRAISAGGGLPIPYRAGDAPLDVAAYFRVWDAARRSIEAQLGHAVQLEIEPGRFLVAESGLLLAEVRAIKTVGGNRFVLVDAGFDNLVRPAMYGSWHEISIVRREGGAAAGPSVPTIVAGPLCESGDVFTQGEGGVVLPRDLPEARVGDLVVIHDAGAYGASQASNYNSRPYAPEIMLDGGKPRLIRRRQTLDELFALEEV
ncbi:MAG TPA: diaminopimelate decarboxylase [Myxococcota bacterium]|jgi:diaminopimelate decarboxylase